MESRKDYRAAIAAAQEAAAAIPEQPAIIEMLAQAQIASGEKNQAIETYARLIKLQPENSIAMMRVAGIHASLKNYDAAITSLRNALSVAPNNTSIWLALAAVYGKRARSTPAPQRLADFRARSPCARQETHSRRSCSRRRTGCWKRRRFTGQRCLAEPWLVR
jgi:predicted Zn-dependent protease